MIHLVSKYSSFLLPVQQVGSKHPRNHGRRLLAALLLSLLMMLGARFAPPVSAQSDLSQTEPDQPTSPQTVDANPDEGETWFVSWMATASGELDAPYPPSIPGGGHIVSSRQVIVQGHATARYSEDNAAGWLSRPFQWMVTDDMNETITFPCEHPEDGEEIQKRRVSIIDPTVQPPPAWADIFVIPGEMFERDDGSRHMRVEFGLSTEGMPNLPYQSDRRGRYCGGTTDSDTTIKDNDIYWLFMWRDIGFDMECDNKGTICTWDETSEHVEDSRMSVTVHWIIRARRLPNSPSITQRPELLEKNVFLPGVPVTGRVDGRLDCDNLETCRAVRKLEAPGNLSQEENIGPSPTGNYPKNVQIGSLPPGQSLLTAQTLGISPGPPDTKPILVAAKLPAWAANIAGIIARKVGNYVAYTWDAKFPEPAIKKLYDVPAIVPFIGGKKAGVEFPQAGIKTEAKSTGEVSLQGNTGGSLLLGDNAVGIKISGKATGLLDLQGVRNVKGEVEFKVFGKVTQKAPLVKAVPALIPAITAIEGFSPAVAKWLQERAQAQLSIEPSWAGTFGISDKTGAIAIDNATISPAIAIKVKAALKAYEGLLEASVGVGGEVKAKFPTPPLSLKELNINFVVFVEGVLLHFGFSEQAGYSCTFPGSCTTTGNSALAAQAATPIWSLPDRSYLDNPDYDSWTVPESASASAQAQVASIAGSDAANAANAEITDVQLADNVSPQAHPALAPYGIQRMLLWTHEAPNKPATSSQELRFSLRTNVTNDTWTPPAAITNDDKADFNRELVFAPDGDGVAVWQRFDVSNPGDMNVDPQAYLSHAQIAASFWNGTSWSAPQQLSTGSSLNMRPSLASTVDGAMVVWIGNASNQLIGDAAHPDIIYSAVYTDNTGTWGAATPILNNVSGLLTLRLAARDSHIAVVYSRDMDGDFATDTDRELFYMLKTTVWGAPVRLTNNQVADESPLLVWAKNGTPQLVWQQGEKLLFLNGVWNVAGAIELPFAIPGDGLQLVNDSTNLDFGYLALSWEQVTGVDTRIGYAIYDPTHALWSQPLSLQPPVTSVVSGTSTMVTNFDSALVTNRLSFAYQMAEVKATTVQIDNLSFNNAPKTGKYSLRYAEIKFEVNLAATVSDIVMTPLNAAPGEKVTVAVRVHNTGQLATDATQVGLTKLSNFDTLLYTLPVIAAGDAATVTISYIQPVDKADLFEIRIDPNVQLHESSVTDNRISLIKTPLFSSAPTIDTPLGPRVGATFQQQGMIQGNYSLTATLHLDDEKGLVVGEALVGFPETPVTSLVTTTVVLSPTQLGKGQHFIYWVGNGEVFGVSLANVYADLSFYPELVIAQGNQISTTITNLGNVTSHGGTLEVYDKNPDEAGAHLLAQFPLPDVAPGATTGVGGTVNLAAAGGLQALPATFYIKLVPPEDEPDFNPSNNLQLAGVTEGTENPASSPVLIPFAAK